MRGAETRGGAARSRRLLTSAAVVLVSLAAATAVRFALDPIVDERVPFLLYLAAVVTSAQWAGWRAGAVATVLSALLAIWFFAYPRESLRLAAPADWVSALVFLATSGLVLILMHRERAALNAVIERDARLREDAARREELEKTLAEARRLESIGRLAGGVAHDFNNLLAVIQGSTQLLRPSAEDRELVDGIETSAKRGAELVRQLLGYAGRQMLMVRPVDVSDAVERATDEAARRLPERIALRVSLAAEPWRISGDESQVEQVLAALLANARDAISGSGTIEVRCENRTLDSEFARQHPEVTPGEYVQLSVLDDGPGLSPDASAHLFEPFFTTRGPSRSGLGLASVYGLVKQTGGHVFVESRPGHGVRVDVYWPRATTAPFGGPVSDRARPRARPLRVLLVEDHDQVRELVRRMVEHFGHEVTSAANGVEALQLARRLEGVDVLLTDVVMPWMNGRQLAEQLARRFPALRVVMMTGFIENDALLQDAVMPGAMLLKKPLSSADLQAALEPAIAARETG